MIMIVMEMVTAMLENANALLIMSMPKIVQFMDVSSYSQSHYIEVPRWEIFMEQDLGRMANFPAFIASKSFDL